MPWNAVWDQIMLDYAEKEIKLRKKYHRCDLNEWKFIPAHIEENYTSYVQEIAINWVCQVLARELCRESRFLGHVTAFDEDFEEEDNNIREVSDLR